MLYHALRFDFDVNSPGGDSKAGGMNFYFGVDNLTNKKPPYGTTATGAGTAIFNIRGRAYYAGVRARF